MNTLLIVGYKNPTKQGITLIFNEPVDLNGHLKATEWWLSWDKIGRAIAGDKYCTAESVAELNEIRN